MLSVIRLLIGIICVQCLCNGATSAEAEQAEKSTNERNMDCLKNPWEDILQNDANDGKYMCEVFPKGNEDGTKGAEKHEKGMKNCVKTLNEGYNRTEEENSGEKMLGSIIYDEQEMWKKGRNFGESEIEGCLILHNSSMKLKSLGLRQNDGGNIIKAGHGSHVELNDCEVAPLSETSPFCLSGSCGLFTNISLRSSSTTFLQAFPSLFSSKALEGKYSGKCFVSVSSSHFSSFCVSSAPFISSPSIPLVSLTHLTFFNISTATSDCSSSSTSFYETLCLMSSCSFSSVCDVYNGGIVPSLNNPFSSLTASNSSFIGCCRTRNVKYEGTSDGKLTPGRQNQTDNGANTFIWCEWNGSKTTGEIKDDTDGASNGGAIFMFDLQNGTLSVSHCAFNNCFAYNRGGGMSCGKIKIVEIENNTFNSCTAQIWAGGGMDICLISQCVRISGCEFQNCEAVYYGGGLDLDTFNVSGAGCIGEENGGGESAYVFDCSFISCELKNQIGGGMCCRAVSAAFKMRSIQFISCKAAIYGGGLDFRPNQKIAPSNNIYCYFFFFHDCMCTNTTPYGHDVIFSDKRNLFSSKNPFHESYTTNTNEKRVCYLYNFNENKWIYEHIEKKDWLKEGMKDRYVGVRGSDSNALCGMNESAPCLTVGHAVESSIAQLSTSITVLDGNHQSEISTINIEDKIICVVGNGREESMIGTKSLSLSSTTLFSVASGQLEVGHVGIDHNATRDSSPSVFVVSDGSGLLSLEDVVILSSVNGESEITASIFVIALSQLRMSDVEIENMTMTQPLFEEPSTEESTSGESLLGNVTIRNVNRTTEGDGVVMAKSVKEGETFVVWNTTIEECECVNGNGGGIKVELSSSTSKVLIGDSISHSGGTTSFNQCKCRGYGGGVMLNLADDSFDFEITTASFDGCAATLGGKNVFVEAQDLSAVINSTSIGFNPVVEVNKADLSELCGRERGKTELIVPLVVFLRAFSSPAYVSGREQGSEFRLCGYEDFPCRTIEEASEYRYLSSERMIRLTNTFSFDEEVELNKESYEIDSCDEDVGLKVGGIETKTQEALVMNSVSSTLKGILFELGGSIGEHSSFIHSSGGTLRFADCGMKMGSGVDSANYSFVSASGGKVEIVGMSCGGNVGEVRFVGNVIVVNGSCECLMDEVIMNQTISNGVSGLIEIATSSSATIQNCSITNCDLPSCGAIQVERCSSTTLKNTSFENITRGKGDGGSLCVSPDDDGTKDTIRVENCSFASCEVNENGKGGGGLSVSLDNPSELYVSSTRFEKCCASSTSGSEGKGGGMMLSMADGDAKFELSGNLIFDQNKAEYGRNMFILANDLNTSVTNDSFKFNYLTMKDDKTLFVGSDNNHQEKDLFMFLIPFSSFELFFSSEGFDVARCGSEEEPCFTMWKGMENMKKEIGKKTIQIEGSTIIRDSFNMSNYKIKKDSKMGEENVKAILNFEKAIGSQLEYFMVNNVHLELINIQLHLSTGFDNSAKTIITNKNGELVITGCSFHSEAGVNNGFDCVFVDAIGGSVEVNDLSMESCNVGNSIFAIHDAGITCQLKNVRVESLNESGGCLLLIKGSELTTKINEGGVEMSLNIDNSSFSGVKRSDNGASILESMSEKKICLVVNSSNITEDKAETSEKGGAIFFTLGTSGSMKMIESTITHCSCSNSTGRGGGVYLATKERGELNFSFVGMKFSANTAKVGNDIFIECFNISSQINESQFQFDLREGYYTRGNAIYGIDSCDFPRDTDLIGLVTIHQSDTIVVSSVNGSDEKQCGANSLPCYSIDYGLMHLTSDFMSLMFIVEESVIGGEINLEEMSLSSKSREVCKVEVETEIERAKEALITTTGTVSLVRVNFVFDLNFNSQHESLISPEGGILEVMNCSFSSKHINEEGNAELANIPFHIINTAEGELQVDGCAISNLILQESALHLSSQLPSVVDSLTICNSTISHSLIKVFERGSLTLLNVNTENITIERNEESLISCLSMKKTIQLANCTIGGVISNNTKGKLMKLENCWDAKMDSCIFDGSSKERNEEYLNTGEEMCRWEGSLVDVVKSSVVIKDTTISNSPEGGITMSGGNVIIEKGEFLNNNPSIEGYESLRRNIICSDSGTLNVMSLKGGDGWKDNTSLWMLNEVCSFEGIVSERDSSFFIPVLESVEAKEETDRMKLTFKGLLFVPCNLSFSVVKRKGEEKEIEKHDFDTNGFLSEREIEGSVAKDLISSCGDEMEVSVHILFGNAESPSSTQSFILKNANITPPKGDEIISKGEDKIEWSLFAFIGCIVIVIILLFVIVVMTVVQRRKLKETEKKVERERLENEQIMEKIEKRRRENNGGSFEMSEMPSTLLEGMTSQIPLLIENDEDLPEPPSMCNDEILNENDLPDLESSLPFSEDGFVSGIPRSHSFNVISSKKPFREKEKKNIKTLHSVIHSVQGDFTLGTRAMDVVDGKEVVIAVAGLFEHLISVGDERVEMMARQLCPYSIFVEEGNNEIFVLAEKIEDEKEKGEMKRWKAPEAGEEGIEKAVVFTLGLILHEMTTGEVPLSECDAEEAQEMMRDGVRPLAEGIEGEDLVELMEKMWMDEPNERLTFAEVKESLRELIENDVWTQ